MNKTHPELQEKKELTTKKTQNGKQKMKKALKKEIKRRETYGNGSSRKTRKKMGEKSRERFPIGPENPEFRRKISRLEASKIGCFFRK